MEGPSTDIILIVASIVASGFFSASETALTSIGEIRTLQLIREDAPGKGLLELWQHFPNRVLTTILIGNNLANIGASAIATDLSYRLMPAAELGEGSRTALAAAVGVMTFLVLIFGEIVPKTYAKHNAERVLRGGPLLVVLYRLTYLTGATRLLVAIARGIAHLLGAKITTDGPMVRIEDIEHMVRVGAETETINTDEARYLAGVLELDDTVAREIMTPRTDVHAIDIAAPVPDLLDLIRREQHSRWPVYREQIDEIAGILYVKDLLEVLVERGPDDVQLEELVRPAHFVPESRKVADLLKDFRSMKVHMAIVVDEFGGMSGLVTLEDVIEEIVGEIYDEYDDEEDEQVTEVEEGVFRLEGGTSLRDVEHALGIEVPNEIDSDTIAGLIVEEAGEVPSIGYATELAGFEFTVTEADERAIRMVEARAQTPAEILDMDTAEQA